MNCDRSVGDRSGGHRIEIPERASTGAEDRIEQTDTGDGTA